MRYRTLAVALLLVTAFLGVAATPGAAEHEERFDQGETWTLEIPEFGGPGTTCVYDEGEHVNRVEVSDGELGDVSIYETGPTPMQINFPFIYIDTVLWTDGSNDAVDQLATESGNCVSNDMVENVVLNVYLFNAEVEAPDGVEVLSGEDVGEAPPAGTGVMPTQDDDDDSGPLDNVSEDGVDDVVGNETEDVDDVVGEAENVTDEVDEVNEVTDEDPTGVTETVQKTVEEAVDTVLEAVDSATNSSEETNESQDVDNESDVEDDGTDGIDATPDSVPGIFVPGWAW